MAPLTARIKRNFRRRRGVSVVITSLMLVVAVSMMGTFLVSWGSSKFASQEAIIANQSSARINQAQESLTVEDAWFFQNNTGYFGTVTVRNSGSVALVVTTIALNNSIVWNKGTTVLTSSYSQISIPVDWKSGDVQSIWVTTKRGTQIQQDFRS